MVTGVPNLREVSPRIYRGGQPTPAGWQGLQALGVTRVIKLNPVSDGRDQLWAGTELIYAPISGVEQILTEPELDTLRSLVRLVEPGTYVHCKHGEDRTGLVVGLYRVWREGWSVDAAYQEMLACGFHPALFGLGKAWFDLTQNCRIVQ